MEQEEIAAGADESVGIAAELARVRPRVARAVLEGRLGPEAAMVLCEALDLLHEDADGEERLVEAAGRMTLDELDALVDQLADAACGTTLEELDALVDVSGPGEVPGVARVSAVHDDATVGPVRPIPPSRRVQPVAMSDRVRSGLSAMTRSCASAAFRAPARRRPRLTRRVPASRPVTGRLLAGKAPAGLERAQPGVVRSASRPALAASGRGPPPGIRARRS